VCDPSVFVGFAEQILDIYSVQSSLPVKLDRLRVYELEKLILVVYTVGDYGRTYTSTRGSSAETNVSKLTDLASRTA